MGTGTGTDVCGLSGGAFSLRKMNPPSITAPYKKRFNHHYEVPYADSHNIGTKQHGTQRTDQIYSFSRHRKKNIHNSLCKKNISLRDGEAIGGGFILRNENTQRFDQHASVPVPVPILRNIDLVRNVCAKAEREKRIFEIKKSLDIAL